ncbi:hypothetical protein GXM_04527 [Nostoc sphaeroides CCNUC1]|uniref:Uncharacterized protein n=1 Tax=Nostoc sphaeroides CCNUC1 TaxID=2653204 RepID=A0A5P8W441_9NOSO|nr:hypothetical protein GXM_04527 [Nostoc sphaeroides CCNUC1]
MCSRGATSILASISGLALPFLLRYLRLDPALKQLMSWAF